MSYCSSAIVCGIAIQGAVPIVMVDPTAVSIADPGVFGCSLPRNFNIRDEQAGNIQTQGPALSGLLGV